MSHQADIIDLFAGITPGSPLAAVRDQRPQAREQAQRSFVALLEPADPGNVGLAERYAVAAFEADLQLATASLQLDQSQPAASLQLA